MLHDNATRGTICAEYCSGIPTPTTNRYTNTRSHLSGICYGAKPCVATNNAVADIDVGRYVCVC